MRNEHESTKFYSMQSNLIYNGIKYKIAPIFSELLLKKVSKHQPQQKWGWYNL